MTDHLPMRLLLNGNLFGQIVTYFYETPWAEGEIEPKNQEYLSCLVAACEFLEEVENFDDSLSKADEDAHFLAELQQHGLNESDLDTITQGQWQIVRESV